MALLEDGRVSEIFIEREAHRGIVGNIYKGRVTRVLPGMQSAFVDLGLERDAFLYVTDVLEELDENLLTPEETGSARTAAANGRTTATRPSSIEEMLTEGQDVLVQVVKEPLGQKGARITAHVSLPGRYLVYMPTVEHVGVSRKIVEDEERRRLKTLLKNVRQERGGGGFIARTAGAARSRGGLRPRRAVPRAHLGRGPRPRRPRPRARAAAPRAGPRAAAAARPPLRRHRQHPPRQRARVPADAGPGGGAAARDGGAGAPVPAVREHPRGARGDRRAGARAALQGLARLRRVPGHQPDGSAGGGGHQQRPLHGQEEPRGDDPQDQRGSGGGAGAPDPPARPRRHHRRGLHRHGGEEEPPEGHGRPRAGAAARPLPVEGPFRERVRPRRS